MAEVMVPAQTRARLTRKSAKVGGAQVAYRRLRKADLAVRALHAVICIAVMLFVTTAWAASKTVIWHDHIDYVRLEPQEQDPRIPPNNHPVRVTPELIHAALGAIKVRFAKKSGFTFFDSDTAEAFQPLFNDKELKRIDGPIAEALARAGPREDVAFAISGKHEEGAVGFLSNTRTTTARLFYRKGKLHLIFREVRLDHRKTVMPGGPTRGYVSDIDRARHPLLPGSRLKETEIGWQVESGPRVFVASAGGRTRDDWLVIDLAAFAAPPQQVAPGRAPAAPAAAVRPPPPAPPPLSPDQVEVRLRQLRDLFERGVITEELYLDKAGQLLDAY